MDYPYIILLFLLLFYHIKNGNIHSILILYLDAPVGLFLYLLHFVRQLSVLTLGITIGMLLVLGTSIMQIAVN